MKQFRNLMFASEQELIDNKDKVEAFCEGKIVAYIKKTDENKAELFWNKDLTNIIIIEKIGYYFENKYAVINPSSHFIKQSMNRNVNTAKGFIRPNKKSTVIDIGFLSPLIKDLRDIAEDKLKVSIASYIKKVAFIFDEKCLQEYEKQYTEEYLSAWLESNKGGFQHDAYEHQKEAFIEAIKYRKRLIRSHTASGKTFAFIMMWKFYKEHFKSLKTLIIVPFVQLIDQIGDEFLLHFPNINILKIGGSNSTIFNYNPKDYVDINKTKYDIVISTYQSLPINRKEDGVKTELAENVKNFLSCFGKGNKGLVICDEAHKSKSSSLQDILSALKNCEYRIGVTGTMINYEDNKWDLYHLYCKFRYGYKQVTNIKELEKAELITPLNFHFRIFQIYKDLPIFVRQSMLNEADEIERGLKNSFYEFEEIKIYTNKMNSLRKLSNEIDFEKVCKQRVLSYAEETNYIVHHEGRLEKSVDMIKELYEADKNMLVFFNRRDLGHTVYDRLISNYKEKVYYIDGGTNQTVRAEIKEKIESENGIILVASFGTTATGINFKNVKKSVILEMKKSEILIGQSLGRLQRLLAGKDAVDVYFCVDKFNNYSNYFWEHFKKVLKTLEKEFGVERVKDDYKNNKEVVNNE